MDKKRTQDPSDKSGLIELIRMKRVMKAKNDPLGSYTGVPDDPHDHPVQDADDL